MYFSKISFITLCAVTLVASSVIRRDATGVITDLSTIKSDLGNLDTAVTAFNGSDIQALAVAGAASTLGTDLDKATNDTDASTAFNSGDSADVTSAAVELVSASVDGLNALVAKEPSFEAGGYNPLVLAQLQSLSASNDKLWSALEAKVTDESNTASLISAASSVSAAYAAAITAYS